MLAHLVTWLLGHPMLIVVIVFASAAIEYVFPPFWGDTFMLAGCYTAGLDHARIPAVFAALFAGSCVGAVAAWWLGRRFGEASMRFVRRSTRAQRIHARAEQLYEKHGARVLALNRFLPGLRAFFLPMAGAGNMRFRPMLVWSTVSNLLYCGVLIGVGLFVAEHSDVDGLAARFQDVTKVGAIVAVTVLIVLTAVKLLRGRRVAA